MKQLLTLEDFVSLVSDDLHDGYEALSKTETGDTESPKESTIRNILAYSRALVVFPTSATGTVSLMMN
ncbi:MAG: hypothetical protein M0R21_10985 [Lentimicrobiaceae bacterium]|jgi:hypothetical protein|nr:hypothetical protein [Lentimicrobiaceae bacterium]